MNRTVPALLAAVALAAACSSSSKPSAAKSPSAVPTPSAAYTVTINPADYSPNVTNPWFPLPPGTTLVYDGETDGDAAHELFTIGDETAVVDGVTCRVVLDRVFFSGKLGETTRDYYAQDKLGNVWYFGEDTAELDTDGSMVSTEGTFHSGEAGALPGIFMAAQPRVGDTHRQEYYPGHAEDFYSVVDLAVAVKVPYKSFTAALRTKEWTPLEPAVLDNKYYVRGIGTVKEVTVKGGDEEFQLVAIKHD